MAIARAVRSPYGSRSIRTFSHDSALIQEKRAEIVRNACRVFIHKGYDGTSMRDLARAVGKSTGAFYHYIGSKKDILYLILDFTVMNQREFLERMRDSTREMGTEQAIAEAIRIYLESFEEYADMHIFVNHVMVKLARNERQMMLDAAQRVGEFFEELLQKGIRQGEFRESDTKMLAQNIVVLGNSWVNRRWFWKKYFTLDQYTRGQTEILLRAITLADKYETEHGARTVAESPVGR
jgi:AcrR family transcriptional regulator